MDIKTTDVGVIIGRFQTNELHSEHIKLINFVLSKHDKVIIFLGVSPTLGNMKHPMDFLTRSLMLKEASGNDNRIAGIFPLRDQKSNTVWSNKLDEKIRDVFNMESITLYGSKDSFIPFYEGRFKTQELTPDNFISATDIRKDLSKRVIASPEFRAGVIYSVYNQYPTVYSTVDVAIFNEAGDLLLGQKPNETEWRFVGGFVDIKDESDEAAAKREGREETGLELSDFQFVTSMKIQDWRYKGMTDRSVMTHFYKCKSLFGSPQPQDDIVALKWVKFTPEVENILVEEHKKLFKFLLK
jgi:bifunctional NMN adenylyltransferase/nudix hydrolase